MKVIWDCELGGGRMGTYPFINSILNLHECSFGIC